MVREWSKEAPRRHLGGSWEGLGKVWGRFWERFGSSLASLGALLSVFFQGFVAKRVQEAAKRLLGLDLGAFGMDVGLF